MRVKILILFLSLSACSNPLLLQENTDIISKAEKEVLDGVTILQLHGSSYEMGFQYGALMIPEIEHSASLFRKFIVGNETSLFRIFIKNLKIRRLINREYRKMPPRYQEELKGLRDGSGIRFRDIKMLACGHAMIDFGCSSFLVNTKDRILHARNFDYAPIEISEYPVIVHYHPDSRLSYVSLSSCGYLGIHTGMNEYGISFSNNNSEGYNEKSESMSYMYASREILEKAKTLKDVESFISDYTSDHGAVWTFSSSKDNDALVIDLSTEEAALSRLNGKNELAVWNFYHNKKIRQRYNTIFSMEDDYRPTAYKKIIHNNIPETVDDMIRILSDTSYHSYPFVPGAKSINNASTLISAVFDNDAEKIYCSFSGGYSGSGKYYLYDTVAKTAVVYHEKPVDYAYEIIKWLTIYRNDQYFRNIMSGNFGELYSAINTGYPVPYKALRILTLLLNYPKIEPDTAQLANTVELMLHDYPLLIELHLLKAGIAAHQGNYEDAASILLDFSRTADSPSPGDLFTLHYFLAKYADKAEYMPMRKKSAETVIKIYEEYRLMYNLENDYFIKDWDQYKSWAAWKQN